MTAKWRIKDEHGDDLIDVWRRCAPHSNEYAAAQIIEELERELAEVGRLREQSRRWHLSFDNAVARLADIHALLCPPDIEHDGKRFQFNPPDELIREVWKKLSDTIRDIPNQIAALRETAGNNG